MHRANESNRHWPGKLDAQYRRRGVMDGPTEQDMLNEEYRRDLEREWEHKMEEAEQEAAMAEAENTANMEAPDA